MRLAGSWLKDGNRAGGIAGTKTKKKRSDQEIKECTEAANWNSLGPALLLEPQD